MPQFKVTPTNIRNGNTAPYYVFSIPENRNKSEKKDAQKLAMLASALSKYDNWNFEVEKI